jgi:hypothetical protein
MKKNPKASTDADDMQPEYDFSKGVRGKYAAKYREGTNLVLLDPDVAETFPDSESVNRALRAIIDAVPRKGRRRGSRSA